MPVSFFVLSHQGDLISYGICKSIKSRRNSRLFSSLSSFPKAIFKKIIESLKLVLNAKKADKVPETLARVAKP